MSLGSQVSKRVQWALNAEQGTEADIHVIEIARGTICNQYNRGHGEEKNGGHTY